MLSNPFFCCDKELSDNNCSQTDPDLIDLDDGCGDVIPEENHEKTQGAVAYGELEKRGSKRRNWID